MPSKPYPTFSWLLLLALTAACDNAAPVSTEWDGGQALSPDRHALVVIPEGPVVVGVSETLAFQIRLLDTAGAPVVDAPVTAGFTDQAHNATLTPNQLTTDGEGRGTIVFTAPLTSDPTAVVAFDIRFKSPTSEMIVPVKVDPSLVGIWLRVAYDGQRPLTAVDAAIFEAWDERGTEPLQRLSVPAESFPVSFHFIGLIEDRTYRLEIAGKNSSGTALAVGSVADVAPDTAERAVVLDDTRLDIEGRYAMATHLTPAGALDWLIVALLSDIPMIANPAAAILDGVAGLVAADPFAPQNFETIRREQALDDRLQAQLESDGEDIAEQLGRVREPLAAALSDITFRGTFEIARTNDDAISFFHQIDRFSFGPPDDPHAPTLGVSVNERAAGVARLDGDDTLWIAGHSLSLGLGTPLAFAFEIVLETELGKSTLQDLLSSEIDCSAVASFLEPDLADMAIHADIVTGCQNAVSATATHLEANIRTLNQLTTLTFAGRGALVIPESGIQVEALKEGRFDVTWTSDSKTATTMKATFEASLKTE